MRTINKSGQILIRNIDSQDKIEIELDKISDSYYLIFDKVKDKRDETKATLAKVTQLLQIVIEIEIWIEEVYVIIEKIGHPTTDSSTIKSHLEEIQVSERRVFLWKELKSPLFTKHLCTSWPGLTGKNIE